MIDLMGLIQLLMGQMGQGDQQPANEDAIENLKEFKVEKKHFTENEEKKLVPPSCAICTFEMKDKAVSLKCNHLFHKECLIEWLRINGICPVCRKEIE